MISFEQATFSFFFHEKLLIIFEPQGQRGGQGEPFYYDNLGFSEALNVLTEGMYKNTLPLTPQPNSTLEDNMLIYVQRARRSSAGNGATGIAI